MIDEREFWTNTALRELGNGAGGDFGAAIWHAAGGHAAKLAELRYPTLIPIYLGEPEIEHVHRT
jgi:hypothetical protein